MPPEVVMEDWWALDDEILSCLTGRGPMAPAEIGAKIGVSEPCLSSLLAMLVQEGRVRICLVDLTTR